MCLGRAVGLGRGGWGLGLGHYILLKGYISTCI